MQNWMLYSHFWLDTFGRFESIYKVYTIKLMGKNFGELFFIMYTYTDVLKLATLGGGSYVSRSLEIVKIRQNYIPAKKADYTVLSKILQFNLGFITFMQKP